MQHKAFTTTLCLLSKKEICLSETDLSEIKQAVTFLQPFQAATQEMSGDSYVCLTLSKLLQQLTADAAGSSLSLGQNLILK